MGQDLLMTDAGPLGWCLVIWLFVLGAAIGSFINVVVYRLPRGLSLLHPPSRCPACETPIRPRDNVPIFGWLLLAGRCRQCGASISARYPLIELTMGLTFAALAAAGPLSGGLGVGAATMGTAGVELHPAEFARYAYQVFLLCGLLSAALTEFDGARFSGRLIWPPLIVGLLTPLAWPSVHPLTDGCALTGHRWMAGASSEARPLLDGLAGLAAGAAGGLLVGGLARWRRGGEAKWGYAPQRAVVALAWIGVFLGWPAAAVLAVGAMLLDQLVVLLSARAAWLRRVGPVAYLFPAALAWILCGGYDRLLVDLLPWQG